MKKNILLFIPILAFMACSDEGQNPSIEVRQLLLEGDETNYARQEYKLPPLHPGDKLKVELALDGKGEELQTLYIKSDEELDTDIKYRKHEVSDESNLTNSEKGILRFSDGVVSTRVLVDATMLSVDEEGTVKLSFYLSSKKESDGAQKELDLKTVEEMEGETDSE